MAQHGGLAAVLVGHKPAELASPTRLPVRADHALQELRAAVYKLRDLDAVIQVLEWDEETYRPAGGARNRASQLAVLGGLRHELLVSDRLGDLLAVAEARAELPMERAELKRLARVRRTAVALPQALVAAFTEARSHCLADWERARRVNDFQVFSKPFDLLLKLLRERAEALRIGADLYDGLLDEHEPGMRRARLGPLLETTGDRLRTLVPDWAERTRRWADSLPQGFYAEDRQRDFCITLLEDMGFDFSRGRLDRSTHPFTMMAGENDVRLTIRSDTHDPLAAVLATLHEGGHALYDQGLPAQLHGSLLADAPSMGVHESQARLWENHVGRSAAFWSHYFPKLERAFPAALGNVSARQFHRALNVIAPGWNRVAADEATYNLHVLVRYELEIALLDGDLAVGDLPGAWNERYRHYLGVAAAGPRDGCLQDVHWALGELGYFPTYTIGNLYAAQLVDAYARSHDLSAELAHGDLRSLRGWLASNVYAHGAELDAEDLIEAATGHRLDPEPFFRRLEQRVAELE